MAKSLWRVEWDIDGGKGPHTMLEFTQETKAEDWAQGLFDADGSGIVLTELIVGKIIHFDGRAHTLTLPLQK